MRDELNKKLIKKYPYIMKDQPGISTRDGWFNLVNCLFNNIQTYVDHNNQRNARLRKNKKLIEEGQADLLNEYVRETTMNIDVVPDDITMPHLVGSKEKFGTLNLHFANIPDNVVSHMIYLVEDLSGKTCEECGDVGKIAGKSWIKCLCNACRTTEEVRDEANKVAIWDAQEKEAAEARIKQVAGYMAGDKGPQV